MKIVIKMVDEFGPAIHTRRTLEQLSKSLSAENEYLIDMEGVNQISRSAADELYNIQHSNNKVYIVNMSPFISRMMDVVTKGRFYPRIRMADNTERIYCTDYSSLSSLLQSLP